MAMTILYPVGQNLYVNLTNQCPCSCTFCIRQNGDGAYGSDSLWLEHTPSFEEVKTAFSKVDIRQYHEIVFCGYGEPMEALEVLCQTAAYLKQQPGCPPLRINTNGLSDLIHGEPTAHRLQGLIDTVSISLNAGDEQEYNRVTRPKFPDAFQALQRFAADCKQYVPHVMFTVVDVIPKEQIALSQALADKLGVPLRVRTYDA
ncbi:TIGR04100 family radical SAM protein [uncultured Ruminococcus sp.]|uniref:TIGR04100 family radical SAM protein n=1 Tax=Ruminococcus sp. TaxID=41978 RepID=UPI00345374F6